jgi:hypothetical protein
LQRDRRERVHRQVRWDPLPIFISPYLGSFANWVAIVSKRGRGVNAILVRWESQEREAYAG